MLFLGLVVAGFLTVSGCGPSSPKVPARFAGARGAIENRTVAVRRLGSKKQDVMALDEAIAALRQEVETRGQP